MPNPDKYFVEEREDGTLAVKGQGKDKPARVVESETKAGSLAHHFAGRHGVVEFKGTDGKFESKCSCPRCKGNR